MKAIDTEAMACLLREVDEACAACAVAWAELSAAAVELSAREQRMCCGPHDPGRDYLPAFWYSTTADGSPTLSAGLHPLSPGDGTLVREVEHDLPGANADLYPRCEAAWRSLSAAGRRLNAARSAVDAAVPSDPVEIAAAMVALSKGKSA